MKKYFPFIGQRVDTIFLSVDRTYINFVSRGTIYSYFSESVPERDAWINHISGLSNLRGGIVEEVIEKYVSTDLSDEFTIFGYDFHTNKGICSLEMRTADGDTYMGLLSEIMGRTPPPMSEVVTDF